MNLKKNEIRLRKNKFSLKLCMDLVTAIFEFPQKIMISKLMSRFFKV